MKPYLLKIPLGIDRSFSVITDISKVFYNQWHYHPEIELMYVVQGTGTGFFGNSVRNINDGDLLLIGANLPHMLKSDPELYNTSSGKITETIVVHFLPSILYSFVQLPENKSIAGLLSQIQSGVLSEGVVKEEVKKYYYLLSFEKNSHSFIEHIRILETVGNAKVVEQMSQNIEKASAIKNEEDGLRRIYHYALNNLSKKIT